MSDSSVVAICIDCGAPKLAPWKRCDDCAFDPTTDHDSMVRSVYFSRGRFEDQREQDTWARDLLAAAASIRRGHPPEIAASERERLEAQLAAVQSVSSAHVASYLLKVFLPGAVFIAALVAVWLVLRALRA